jgi:hypothetical protein
LNVIDAGETNSGGLIVGARSDAKPVSTFADRALPAGVVSMSFIDDAKAMATMAIPGPGTPEEQRRLLDAMSMDELAGLWCSLQYLGIPDYTEDTWPKVMYFDHLPHDAPERAFEMVLTVLRSEVHKSVKMELNNKLMIALVSAQGERLIGQIEAEARGNAALRWLLGGAYWWTSDTNIKARLAAFADQDAWRADEATRDAAAPIDFAGLPRAELARAWIEQKCKPRKDQDDNWMTLCDYERELIERDPDKMIDLIIDILKVESNPQVLSYLAAGPLEDVIGMKTIDRIEREAAEPAFRALLEGVWYWNEAEELKARLDAILERTPAPAPGH